MGARTPSVKRMNPLYRNDRAGQFPKSWYAATTDIPDERLPLYGHIDSRCLRDRRGFTGLSAALHLAQKGLSVVVLDAHRAGFGASGRNGGQVGSGYNKSQHWLAKRWARGRARAVGHGRRGKGRPARPTSRPSPLTPTTHQGWHTAAIGPLKWPKNTAMPTIWPRTYGYDQIDHLDKSQLATS